MNDEQKAQLEQYRMESGFYSIEQILIENGWNKMSARFAAIFRSNEDESEEEAMANWPELARVARAANKGIHSDNRASEMVAEVEDRETRFEAQNGKTAEFIAPDRPTTGEHREIGGLIYEVTAVGNYIKFDDEDVLAPDWNGGYPFEAVCIDVRLSDLQAKLAETVELKSVMTVQEAADEFGVHRQTVHDAIEKGLISSRQSGKTWLIRRADAAKRWSKKN